LEKVVTDPRRGSYRAEVMKRYKAGSFGLEALPLLRKLLNYDDIFLVLEAAECVAKLGAAAKEAEDCEDLQNQLNITGSKIWDYSGYANAYSTCLDALEKIEADEELIVSYVARNIGIEDPDDLIASFRALQALGSKDAKDLLKRAAAFRQPDLNLRQSKEVEKLLNSVR